eukprot:gene16318-22507_t
MFDLMLAYFDEYVTQRVQKETGETGHQLEAMLDEHRSADVVQFAARLSDAFLTILDTDAHTFGTAYGRFFIDQGATELGISPHPPSFRLHLVDIYHVEVIDH